MKTTWILLGALVTACKLQAGPSIVWISDSYNSFDVMLSGTGLGWSGTVTSPSGLWQLSSANIIEYPAPGQNASLVSIENVGVATFLGSLSPQFPQPDPSALAPFNAVSLGTYGGYEDYFSPVAPIDDRNSLVYGYLAGLDWSGMSTITVTLIPNTINVSSWQWIATYSASGESLEAPEPNTISIAALAIIFGMAALFCKKLKLATRPPIP
jgi:hypothetical protein